MCATHQTNQAIRPFSFIQRKSTTAKLFAEAGVPVYDADAAVHQLYEGEAAPAIEAAFPGTTSNGKVDRPKLSARVVHDPAAIKQLEQIVHPMLGASRQKFFADAEAAKAPVVVLDIPLLFETGGEKRVDAVVVVSTSPELQRKRVLERGTMDEAKLDEGAGAAASGGSAAAGSGGTSGGGSGRGPGKSSLTRVSPVAAFLAPARRRSFVSTRNGGRSGKLADSSGIATLYTGAFAFVRPSGEPRCA